MRGLVRGRLLGLLLSLLLLLRLLVLRGLNLSDLPRSTMLCRLLKPSISTYSECFPTTALCQAIINMLTMEASRQPLPPHGRGVSMPWTDAVHHLVTGC